MKKIILSAVAVMSLANVSSAGDDFGAALKSGKFAVDAKVFYFNRDFDRPGTDREALTAGGTFSYVSGDFYGLKVGTTLFTNNSLDIVDRSRSNHSGLLDDTDASNPDGENINLVGEAYLQYNVKKLMVKIGRQILNTPLMSGDQSRTLPTTYEAAIIRSNCLSNTMIELGYVNSYTGFGSAWGDFEKKEATLGDDGLAYIYATNKSIENLTLRGQYIKAISDDNEVGGVTTNIAVEDYRYFDVKYNLPFGTKTFVSANYAGNSYDTQDDSAMIGAKVGTTLGMFNASLMYVQIFDNDWARIEDTMVYTDWQQGYNNFGPSTAFGVAVSAKPMKDLSVLARFVDVSSDDYSSNAARTGENLADDYTETNFDATYVLNDWSKIRFRYSIKDQSSASEKAGTPDRNDFRTMYYIYF